MTIDSWQESYDKPRHCVEKQRQYPANKGPYSRGYGLPNDHLWFWELDCKEGRVPKNWCIWTVCSMQRIRGNNRIGRTRDLFKKIGATKGKFHAKMGSIKDWNGRDLTAAEDIKKRWQEYTELYKEDLYDPDNNDGDNHSPRARHPGT